MICSTALAIGMHLNSWHTKYNDQFNTTNTGAYVQYNSFVVGTYHNSESRQSNYVGYMFDLDESCRFEAQVGAVTGYATKVLPYVAVSAKFDLREIQKGFGAKISAIPLYTTNKKIEGLVFGASVFYTF